MVLGWILVVIGLVATLAGVVGGIAAMFKNVEQDASRGALGPGVLPTEFVKALTELVKVLIKAPQWLAMVVVGILLVLLGAPMI